MYAFYPGLHQPADAQHFDRCMISLSRVVKRDRAGHIKRNQHGELRMRKKPIDCQDVFLDSNAFEILKQYGCYPDPPEVYAEVVNHMSTICGLTVATTEDLMCEPFMLKKTGLTVAEHQRQTIERYDTLKELITGTYLMPVLQGYLPYEYVRHLEQYGDRLAPEQWVGVGSVCKRNTNPEKIEAVLLAIKAERPDLRLHGFGVKTIALASSVIRSCLHSADSMAWSYAARKQGRDGNDHTEAQQFITKIDRQRIRRRVPVIQNSFHEVLDESNRGAA